MDRLNQFKKKRFEFGSSEARIARACEVEKRRKQQRAEDIARNRRFSTIIDEKLSKVISLPKEIQSNNAQMNNRVKQLLKWKAEKELKKKIKAQTKKPPFVVGIPHHNPWSVAIENTGILDCQHHKNNKAKLIIPTRITRATAKRLAEKQKINKSNTLQKCKPETLGKGKKKECKNYNEEFVTIFPSTDHYAFHAPKGIAPVRMLDIKNFSYDTKQKTHTDNIVKTSFVFDNNIINDQTVNVNLYKDENYTKTNLSQTSILNQSHSDVQLIEDKNKNETILKNNSSYEKKLNIPQQSLVPAAFSPFITTKRGKSNVRDEQRERLGLNSPRNIVLTKNNISEILNVSVSESPKTAQYYKYLLNQETDRLHNLCENWKKIQENLETTDDGRYIINQAIGQTILLITKKFKRFSGLVSDCMKDNKELLVTCRDLQGFWDMMSMEIKDCHSRFEKLEKLKASSWIEEKTDEKKVARIKKQSIKKNKINGKSNMRAFIEASRKQRINDQKVDLEFDHIVFSKSQRYYTRASAGKQNLTKIPELKLDNSISYINSDQTPGKGILKHTNKLEKFHVELNKSVVKVNFNEVIIHDSTLPNKSIECYENEARLKVEKTLNFEKNVSIDNDIVEKSNSKNTSELMIQDIDNIKLFSKKSATKEPKSFPINGITIPSTRILRSHSQFEHNKMSSTVNNIDNFKEIKIQLNSSPLKKLNSESIKENDCASTPHQRRSTRKSIKLNYSGECTACTSITKTKSDEFICYQNEKRKL